MNIQLNNFLIFIEHSGKVAIMLVHGSHFARVIFIHFTWNLQMRLEEYTWQLSHIFQTMESQHTYGRFHTCFKQWKANKHMTAFTHVSNNGKPKHTWQLSHNHVSNNGKSTPTWQLSNNHVSNNGKPKPTWQLSHNHVSNNGKPTHTWQLSRMFQTM